MAHNIKLALYAPPLGACDHFTPIWVTQEAYECAIAEVQELRYSVHKTEGLIQESDNLYNDLDHDEKIWHLLAYSPTTAELIGCIRCICFDLNRDSINAEHLISLGGVDFLHGTAHAATMQALDQFLSEVRLRANRLLYIGGMAVQNARRGQGIGAKLGLGINALARILGQTEGIAFAAYDNGSASLFRRLGGYPLATAPDPFFCQKHRCQLQTLGFHPQHVASSTNRIVEGLLSTLLQQHIYTRPQQHQPVKRQILG